MIWLIDASWKCPACEKWSDAAADFGETYYSNLPHDHPEAKMEGLEDGLEGTCGRCGANVVIRIQVKKPKKKWNGWNCTNCDRYHGYGSIFTYGDEDGDPDVLCATCNYQFRGWLEALGLGDQWKGQW